MNQWPPFVSIAHLVKSSLVSAPTEKTARIASESRQMKTVKRKLASTPTKLSPTKIA